MSHVIEKESPCFYCQFPNKVDVWSIVNVKEDPELKDLVLGGEINMTECTACKKVFYAENFLLYHDPDNELMAFVYPAAYDAEREKWVERTEADFNLSQAAAEENEKLTYRPVGLFGLQELVETVQWVEEADIQGEIVNILSCDHGFGIRRLRPATARALRLPAILPVIEEPGLNTREAVLAGLAKVEEINDRLTIYTAARQFLISHPATELQIH